jgi:hypothetical protein
MYSLGTWFVSGICVCVCVCVCVDTLHKGDDDDDNNNNNSFHVRISKSIRTLSVVYSEPWNGMWFWIHTEVSFGVIVGGVGVGVLRTPWSTSPCAVDSVRRLLLFLFLLLLLVLRPRVHFISLVTTFCSLTCFLAPSPKTPHCVSVFPCSFISSGFYFVITFDLFHTAIVRGYIHIYQRGVGI